MDSTLAPKQGMLRDWGYYSLWWGLIFTILGSLMYRDGPQDQFLNPALQQALFGLAFGLVCALVFTLVQNGVNKERRKVKSWILAVLIWIVMRLAWLFAAGAL